MEIFNQYYNRIIKFNNIIYSDTVAYIKDYRRLIFSMEPFFTYCLELKCFLAGEVEEAKTKINEVFKIFEETKKLNFIEDFKFTEETKKQKNKINKLIKEVKDYFYEWF